MKLNRPDVNTLEYWNNNYKKGERGGWWRNTKPLGEIKTFLSKELDLFVTDMPKGYKPKLIEIGGGTGLGGSRVLNDYPQLELYNLDISTYATEVGKEKYPNIKQVCWDCNQDSKSLGLDNKFDFLIAQEVLEHLKNPVQSLKYMMNLLKIRGYAFIGTPYREGYTGGPEHIQSFEYADIPGLFFQFTDEVTVCNFMPIGANLHMGIKFKKTK